MSESALTLVMAHINLYLCNPHQVSASYPFSSIDASVHIDAYANAVSVWPGLRVSKCCNTYA